MKSKQLKILFTILIGILFIIIPNIVKADNSTVKLESITVTNPKTGTYTTGEKITIVAKYTDEIEGQKTIQIKFGKEGMERSLKGSIKGNTITYEYVITNEDSGKLSLINESSIQLKGSEITANPIKWTDTSKLKYTIDNNWILRITGIEEIEKHDYFGFITNTTTEPKLKLDTNNYVESYDFNHITDMDIVEYLERNGDIYFWICEQQRNYDTGKVEQKFILKAKKIERPKLELGKRIFISLIGDSTTGQDSWISMNTPHDKETKRMAKLKVGQK